MRNDETKRDVRTRTVYCPPLSLFNKELCLPLVGILSSLECRCCSSAPPTVSVKPRFSHRSNSMDDKKPEGDDIMTQANDLLSSPDSFIDEAGGSSEKSCPG